MRVLVGQNSFLSVGSVDGGRTEYVDLRITAQSVEVARPWVFTKGVHGPRSPGGIRAAHCGVRKFANR